jgi:hypothetical protein
VGAVRILWLAHVACPRVGCSIRAGFGRALQTAPGMVGASTLAMSGMSTLSPIDLRGLASTLRRVCPLNHVDSYLDGQRQLTSALRHLAGLSGDSAAQLVQRLERKGLVHFQASTNSGRGHWRYC